MINVQLAWSSLNRLSIGSFIETFSKTVQFFFSKGLLSWLVTLSLTHHPIVQGSIPSMLLFSRM